jgi:hypothetical protein
LGHLPDKSTVSDSCRSPCFLKSRELMSSNKACESPRRLLLCGPCQTSSELTSSKNAIKHPQVSAALSMRGSCQKRREAHGILRGSGVPAGF